mmetsp:Transcript_17190/g.38541  ORF Transcript_17190/g.38541 Transcript_17190/m.38541 type:complete len:266 (+) Transcript_17190:183-980(+)
MHAPERPSHSLSSRDTEQLMSNGESRSHRISMTPPGCMHVCRSVKVFRSQTQRRPSIPPEAASCMASQKPAYSTEASCAVSWARTLPVSAWASLRRPSTAPKRKTGWVGWLHRQLTGIGSATEPAWIQWSTVPAFGFQTRTVPSSDAVMTERPLLAKQPYATDDECAEKICITVPSGSFHIHAVASSDPASNTAPRLCHATQLMPCVGPSRAITSAPVSLSHTRTVPSSAAVASIEPSALKATEPTVSVWPSSRATGTASPARHR